MMVSILLSLLLAQPIVLQQSLAHSTRLLTFCDLEWSLKRSEHIVGPGPNNFSDEPADIFLDTAGRLHLKIVERNGHWRCAEAITTRSFGYGTYRFMISSGAQFDSQAVFGLFVWHDTDPAYHHREIDIELGHWGRKENQNAQFVVQPYTRDENIHRFDAPHTASPVTYQFTWRADGIEFQSWKGDADKPAQDDMLQSWNYHGRDLPHPGGEQVRMNLWLLGGRAPQQKREVEVVIDRFSFQP